MSNLFKSAKTKLGALVVGAMVIGTQAQAALTAADVDTSGASADVGVVVIAILGLLVTVFGFRKVLGLVKGS